MIVVGQVVTPEMQAVLDAAARYVASNKSAPDYLRQPVLALQASTRT